MFQKRYLGEQKCECGRKGTFRVLVSIYPLGLKPRKFNSSPSFVACDLCIDGNGDTVDDRLVNAMRQSFERFRSIPKVIVALVPRGKRPL